MNLAREYLLSLFKESSWNKFVRKLYRGKLQMSAQKVLQRVWSAGYPAIVNRILMEVKIPPKPMRVRGPKFVVGDFFVIGPLIIDGNLTVTERFRCLNGVYSPGVLRAQLCWVGGDLSLGDNGDVFADDINVAGAIRAGRTVRTYNSLTAHRLLDVRRILVGGHLCCGFGVTAGVVHAAESARAGSFHVDKLICTGPVWSGGNLIVTKHGLNVGGDLNVSRNLEVSTEIAVGGDIHVGGRILQGVGYAVTVGSRRSLLKPATCTSPNRPANLKGGKWKKVGSNA